MTKILCCKSCGTVGEAGCDCGVGLEYISPGKLAEKAIAEHPEESDRMIADRLGVDNSTVSAARKRGVGNPTPEKRKGKDGKSYPAKRTSPKMDKAREVVRPLVEAGERVSREKVSEETGFAQSVIQQAVIAERARKETLENEPQVTREMLSLSAQVKFDAAVRRESKRLENEFELAVREEARKAIEETILPSYNKSKEEYDSLVKLRAGVMTRAEYNLIRACLHPDNSMTGEKRQRAWDLFSKLEIAFLDESQFQTSTFEIPNTYEGLMAMRNRRTTKRSNNKTMTRSRVA